MASQNFIPPNSLSGIGVTTLGNLGDGKSNIVTQTWKDPQIYLARAASGKSTDIRYDFTDFVAGDVEEEILWDDMAPNRWS